MSKRGVSTANADYAATVTAREASGFAAPGKRVWQADLPRFSKPWRARHYMPRLQWILGLVRAVWPIPRLFGWAAVTRYEDVVEVLSHPEVFGVPFGAEMARLNDGSKPGTPFMLGIDDPNEHERQTKLLMHAFPRSDVERKVRPLAFEIADESIRGSPDGRNFDAISRLITHVPVELCKQYYGLKIEEPQRFAASAIKVSRHLFGFPPIVAPKPGKKDSVDGHAEYVRAVVNHAIDAKNASGIVLPRLRGLLLSHPPQLSCEEARAFLMGMIVGFVPTNTLAGGNILEMLLTKPAFLEAAKRAAVEGDDDLLERCLFEAMRFKPHNPGPFRICNRDYTIAADRWWLHRAKIKEGTKIWAMTHSATFDRRHVPNPYLFEPARAASDYMMFGYGMHWCVGNVIARAQITQTLKALLLRPKLARASRLIGEGASPKRLLVNFEPIAR